MASTIQNAANVALIVSLAVGVVATILVVWMGNVNEKYLRRELGETTERAANANAAANRIENDNLVLRQQVASLEIGAAEARAAQALAERALLELRRQMADRVITPLQRAKMLALLKTEPPSTLVIQSLTSAGREGLQFALAIASVFRDAGWTVTDPNGLGSSSSPLGGVFLVVSPDMEATGLPDFLVRVIIEGELSPRPITTSPSTRRGPGILEVWVSSKAATPKR